jgi:cytochrome c553
LIVARVARKLTAASHLLISAAVFCLFAPAAGAAEPADARLTPCLACHGDGERAALPGVPLLGAQPVDYLTIQLYLFREKMRAVEPMTQMLAGVKDDELKRLAAAIAKLPAPAASNEPADPKRIERAQALVVQHRCNFCHNRDYSGQQNVPRLAAQREEYLLKALRDYKSNARRGYDATMDDVLYPLTDEDFKDLAHFLARQR